MNILKVLSGGFAILMMTACGPGMEARDMAKVIEMESADNIEDPTGELAYFRSTLGRQADNRCGSGKIYATAYKKYWYVKNRCGQQVKLETTLVLRGAIRSDSSGWKMNGGRWEFVKKDSKGRFLWRATTYGINFGRESWKTTRFHPKSVINSGYNKRLYYGSAVNEAFDYASLRSVLIYVYNRDARWLSELQWMGGWRYTFGQYPY